jgi:hypothetical protein
LQKRAIARDALLSALARAALSGLSRGRLCQGTVAGGGVELLEVVAVYVESGGVGWIGGVAV